MARATEYDISIATLKIAAAQHDGLATFHRLRREIPNHVNLSGADLKMSETRPNEPLWHQLIRNIRSHHQSDDNFIHLGYLEHVSGRGYRITRKGLAFLQQL